MADVYHPWREMREKWPEWQIVHFRMPRHMAGGTDGVGKVVVINSNETQAERRSTLAHELHHVAAGDVGCQDTHRERAINIAAARDLVPIEKLVDACLWAHDTYELAEECWVDEATILTRLTYLDDIERRQLREALAQRDFHEEGI